jgi:hypothetical protein
MHDSALEKQVTRLGDLERRILDKVMRLRPVARIESLVRGRAAH